MIKIGKIVNVKGLKGEVKVLSNSDFKELRFAIGNHLFIKYQEKNIKVEISKWLKVKNFDIIKFKEFNFLDEVEKFKNCDIYGEDLPEDVLEDNKYFQKELIAFKIHDLENRELGKVIAVEDGVKNTNLRIKTSSQKTKLVPFIDEFISNVDREQKIIKIKNIPGLLDD